MRPDPASFKDVLRCFASGVTVVTTASGGQPHGLTVSAFCSVSADPPRVLVCLDNESDSKPLVDRAGAFAVHVLGRDGAHLGLRFAKSGDEGADAFAGLATSTQTTGSPILADCLAWLDCRVEASHAVGDHTVFIGAVTALGRGADQSDPVLYFDRAWRVLDPRALEP